MFSNSSPVEGIERAIRNYADTDKRLSLYVFGDQFTGDSIEAVLRTVRRLNRERDGERRVRIHAIGFPTVFTASDSMDLTGAHFAALMRELCHENGGTFVGLSEIRR